MLSDNDGQHDNDNDSQAMSSLPASSVDSSDYTSDQVSRRESINEKLDLARLHLDELDDDEGDKAPQAQAQAQVQAPAPHRNKGEGVDGGAVGGAGTKVPPVREQQPGSGSSKGYHDAMSSQSQSLRDSTSSKYGSPVMTPPASAKASSKGGAVPARPGLLLDLARVAEGLDRTGGDDGNGGGAAAAAATSGFVPKPPSDPVPTSARKGSSSRPVTPRQVRVQSEPSPLRRLPLLCPCLYLR
jgi:hypothetical protein